MANSTSESSQSQSSSTSTAFGQNSSDWVSLVALLISLAAFATTLLQVLQQYLASADGFRRCAPSVIGPWSKGTKRKFRRRELRFEVVFETPVIFLARPDNKKGPIANRDIHNMDGSDESYKISNIYKPEKESEEVRISTVDDERASWMTLLAAIQREEADSRAWEAKNSFTARGINYEKPTYTICHSLQKKTRSWDFMPPAVTKPFATTTVSHLVEMTAMLGMYWKAFEVTKGNVRAEGNGYILTSSSVNGLGLLATFSVTGQSTFEGNRVIPNHDIKDLVFGYVFNVLDEKVALEFGNLDRVKKTMTALNFTEETIQLYETRRKRPNILPATFEIIGMIGKTFRIRGSCLKMLPNPTNDKWSGDTFCINWFGEMKEFQWRLKELIDELTTSKNPEIPALLVTISNEWSRMMPMWVKHDIDMREKTHDALDKINEKFDKKENFSGDDIKQVMASHIKIVLERSDEIQLIMNSSNMLESEGKLVKFYFENVLPGVKDDTLSLDEKEKLKRGVIWLGLVFHMICWFSLHDFHKDDVNTMPADMRGSRMPVFIG